MIPTCEPDISPDDIAEVVRALKSGHVALGPEVGMFEQAVAKTVGLPHAVATSSGSAALHVALKALGIGPGDKVLVPTLTFIATAAAVVHCGATPVFVDSERETWGMDPDAVWRELQHGPKVKAIIATHLYGHPCQVEALRKTADEWAVALIEDACEALGASPIGLGDVTCLSFNHNKIITTGGGGMALTRDAALARRMRLFVAQARVDDVEFIHGIPEINDGSMPLLRRGRDNDRSRGAEIVHGPGDPGRMGPEDSRSPSLPRVQLGPGEPILQHTGGAKEGGAAVDSAPVRPLSEDSSLDRGGDRGHGAQPPEAHPVGTSAQGSHSRPASLVGYNYRLSAFQAALGLSQLGRLEEVIEKKLDTAGYYSLELHGVAEALHGYAKGTYWMPAFLLDRPAAPVIEALLARGIGARPVWFPLHQQPCFPGPHAECPVADDIHRRGIILPCSSSITPAQRAEVVAAVRAVLDQESPRRSAPA